jgi:ATP-dependent Lhr-like helicase
MEAAPGEVRFLVTPPSPETVLSVFSDPVRGWFGRHFGEPTPAQRFAWSTIRAGQNLLLCAPTGSGKTLAAFLPILDCLLADPIAATVRCLYLTPLKALGNDLRANLEAYLSDLDQSWPGAATSLRVGLRTGDASASDRRSLVAEPPDVLATTPESLAILLSQPVAGDLFTGLRWVIVDEVHALAPSKRGADLALSLERLENLAANPLQRIGLSATCAPLADAARFLVGTHRSCTIAQVRDASPLHLVIEPLEETAGFLRSLVDRLQTELTTNRTTLIFTNARGLAERLTWALTRRFPTWAAQIAVHHSSLDAARRQTVEQQLKQGRLRAVVSSTSLELGIDIGAVDSVVLVHPPGDAVRLLQRVGRSGHGPGRPRRGLVLTATPAELLEATITAAASRAAQCESLRLHSHPLDVLCQQLLGMAAQAAWSAAEAFQLVSRAFPYKDLPRDDLNRCLDYLSGRRADGVSWLPARLRWDGDRFRIRDERTARLVRRNLGTILTEEPRSVRQIAHYAPADIHNEKPIRVGEVEGAFADRLEPGDRFLLDGRCLEYRRPAGQALLVAEVVGRPAVPRWRSDCWPLSTELAGRLFLLRIQAAEGLRDGPPALTRLLRQDYGLGVRAVRALSVYFQRQECVSEIPERATCLVETVASNFTAEYYVHTPLNRLANDALARVAVWRLACQRGCTATSIVADLGFMLSIPAETEFVSDDLRALLSVREFASDLEKAVADSITRRERFRRVALIGLMLLRNPFGGRRRVGGQDWAERRLFSQVMAADPDFILLRQARREVLECCCDAAAAQAFLADFPRWTIRFRRLADVSPFAAHWTQAAAGPLGMVETPVEVLRRLHATLTSAGEANASSH